MLSPKGKATYLTTHPTGQDSCRLTGQVNCRRTLLVETSGTDKFFRTRSFYEQIGYETEACIRDYYDAGDDKIVFRKAL